MSKKKREKMIAKIKRHAHDGPSKRNDVKAMESTIRTDVKAMASTKRTDVKAMASTKSGLTPANHPAAVAVPNTEHLKHISPQWRDFINTLSGAIAAKQ